MKNIILILTFLISLSGCAEKEKEEIHTVDWFLNNIETMNETLKKCNNNVGELGELLNCKNAYMAQHQNMAGSSDDLTL